MMAISVRQPWAYWIVHGFKDVENRTWKHGYRGEVLIHAAAGLTAKEYDAAVAFVWRLKGLARGVPIPRFEELPRGGIVGVARVTGCTTYSPSPWFTGPVGFVLAEAYPLPFRPSRGALGFYVFEGLREWNSETLAEPWPEEAA
jgi:hypothetical protein